MSLESVPRAPRHPPPTGADLLTLEEGAELCTVEYETFRRWVAKGVLPHVIVGPFKLKRVRRRAVEKLIKDTD